MVVNLLEFRLPLPLTWDELGFTSVLADNIAHRFTLKLLLEKQVDIGLKERVLITLDRSKGKFEVIAFEAWLDNIFVPLDLEALSQSKDHAEFFTMLVADGLAHAARHFKKDVDAIENIRIEALRDRDNLKIALPFKTVTLSNHLIEPYLKVKGQFARNTQLYVKITDLNTSKNGEWLLLEAGTQDVLSAVSSFNIENGVLTANYESNDYSTSLRNRGYKLPIVAKLSNILG